MYFITFDLRYNLNNNKNFTIVQMNITDNHDQYARLRESYPVFTYKKYQINQSENGLAVTFVFKVGQDFVFKPGIRFHGRAFGTDLAISPATHSLIFHIGLVEMISYWKAFCCPTIHIEPFQLNQEQQQWWHKLFLYGLGEFFYSNGVPIDDTRMLSFSFDRHAPQLPAPDRPTGLGDEVIIPVGGGKDSVVAIDLIQRAEMNAIPLVVNHREATRRVIETAGHRANQQIQIDRELDPLLLTLNDRGFLNGHTPFSALLAFISVFAAHAHRVKHIALSNESSANEPSIPGTKINHQYSKSYEFESDFRSYVRTFLSNDVEYFSLLRPLNEIQIAAAFSALPRYHKVFRSCNVGSKSNSWCGQCPKCLFTFIILAPFMDAASLSDIFGKNLFEEAALSQTLDQLTGHAPEKPFECVGTTGEVNAAVLHIINEYNRLGRPLPALLKHYQSRPPTEQPGRHGPLAAYLNDFNQHHHLSQPFAEMINKRIISNHPKNQLPA